MVEQQAASTVCARRALQALVTLGMQAGVDYNYVPLGIDRLPLLSGIRPRSSVWKCFSIWRYGVLLDDDGNEDPI